MYIYLHNPRCRKSRQALTLLQDRDIDVQIRRYLDDPLSKDEIKEVLAKLKLVPLDIIRTKEKLFKELGYTSKDKREEEEWIALMAEHPKLIERPILISDTSAIVGRPPERVLEIL